MRIGILAPLVTPIAEPQRGGSQAFVSDLARGLSGRGHEVVVYAASGSDVPDVRVVEIEVDVSAAREALHRPGAGSIVPDALEDAFARAWDAVGEHDVVHGHAFDPPALDLAPTQRALVHTLHLPPTPEMVRAVRDSADHVVTAAVSPSHHALWRSCAPVPRLLPDGVPVDRIASGEGGTSVLFVGRLSPEKGAVEAIAIASTAGVPLDIVGDAYDARYAREVMHGAARHGARLHAPLPRQDVWRVMGSVGAVLCPIGWDEPYGLVAAEAQAAGTPVVGYARGGLVDVVRDGVTGRLVEPGDVEAAADAVREVTRYDRDAIRRHAERELSLDASLDAHEELYREVT